MGIRYNVLKRLKRLANPTAAIQSLITVFESPPIKKELDTILRKGNPKAALQSTIKDAIKSLGISYQVASPASLIARAIKTVVKHQSTLKEIQVKQRATTLKAAAVKASQKERPAQPSRKESAKKLLELKITDYIDRQREYNKTIPLGLNSRKLRFMPTSLTELREANELLNLAVTDFSALEKILGVDKSAVETARVRTISMSYFKGNYRTEIFFRTSKEQAAKSKFPELVQLFELGGISLVHALLDAGFGLASYSESDSFGGYILSREGIIENLADTVKRLGEPHHTTVAKFVSKYQDIVKVKK